jgi:hypothetical protein
MNFSRRLDERRAECVPLDTGRKSKRILVCRQPIKFRNIYSIHNAGRGSILFAPSNMTVEKYEPAGNVPNAGRLLGEI